ncbi:hypothetical protein Gohar_018857 [Gossypium harknessii]|uniref:Uncharacterized protein n=1 Tax=Gossypium harknessii TaxID=34285 RepID=A0A7J9GB38_9ROSI|nr:hypothetical protein [Gossypium harknessii]
MIVWVRFRILFTEVRSIWVGYKTFPEPRDDST